MVKAKGKGNATIPVSKAEKKDEPNNVDAMTTEAESEKMDEEMPAVVNSGEEKVEEESKEEETEVNGDQEETEKNEDEEEKEENGEGEVNENEKMEEDTNEENAEEDKKDEKTEEDKKDEKTEEDKKEENNKEQVEIAPAKQGKRLRRRTKKKKKPTQEAADSKPAENTDKPEASKEQNGKKAEEQNGKKAESKGMIFMCSSKTKKDCYRYNLLGLPASKKDLVAKIYKGMRLFLFDIDLKLMYGIYKAAAPGGYNIEPKAFNSAFPAQVKFNVMEDCVPLAEEKFKAAIKKNYFGKKNKFDCQLDAEQVKNLCKLFKANSKTKQVDKPRRQEIRKQVDKPRRQETRGDRDRGRRQGRDGRPSFGGGREHIYREPGRAYAPLPPRPVYASYERPLEPDYYRRDALELHDRRLVPVDHDRFELSRREDIIHRDPYVHREPLPYYEPAYLAGPPAVGYYQPPLYRY